MYDEAVQRHVYDMLDVWRKYERMDRGICTTIFPVKKDILLRRSSTVDWIKGYASYVQQLACILVSNHTS